MASQVQRYIQDTHTFPKSAEEVNQIVSPLLGHNYVILEKIPHMNKKPINGSIQIHSFLGIKRCHRITFHHPFGISGFQSSNQTLHAEAFTRWSRPATKFLQYNYPCKNIQIAPLIIE